jgi:hypothetical protein
MIWLIGPVGPFGNAAAMNSQLDPIRTAMAATTSFFGPRIGMACSSPRFNAGEIVRDNL